MLSQLRSNKRRLWSLLFASAVLTLAFNFHASTSTSAAEEEKESAVKAEASQIARGIQMTARVEARSVELKLVKEPVLRFGDVARDNESGSLWLWQHAGRPQAVLELFRPTGEPKWVYVFHSLSQEPLSAKAGPDVPTWAPTKPGIEWKAVPDAPQPSAASAVRARQMKDLAQRFTGHEFWDPNNSRYELRLLVRPVHKYEAPEFGALDGAVFLLCHETNPEVLLLIEAAQTNAKTAVEFRYALARLGHSDLHVEYNEREIWTQPRLAGTSPGEKYFLMLK